MSPDLQTLLRDAAPEPTILLDETRLVDRALRQRMLLRVGTAVAALVTVVAATVLGLQAVRGPADLEIADQPGEPVPSGWQTLRSGGAAFAVPGDWPVQRIDGPDDPMPCLDLLEITEHRVYLADRLYLPSCPAGPSGHDPQQGQVTVYAYPAAQMSQVDRDALVSNGHRVDLPGGEAWRDDGDSHRTYLFDGLNAVLLIAYQPDPQLADQIVATVHPADAPSDTRPSPPDDIATLAELIDPPWPPFTGTYEIERLDHETGRMQGVRRATIEFNSPSDWEEWTDDGQRNWFRDGRYCTNLPSPDGEGPDCRPEDDLVAPSDWLQPGWPSLIPTHVSHRQWHLWDIERNGDSFTARLTRQEPCRELLPEDSCDDPEQTVEHGWVVRFGAAGIPHTWYEHVNGTVAHRVQFTELTIAGQQIR